MRQSLTGFEGQQYHATITVWQFNEGFNQTESLELGFNGNQRWGNDPYKLNKGATLALIWEQTGRRKDKRLEKRMAQVVQ